MGSQSDSTPNSVDDKAQNPASQPSESTVNQGTVAKADVPNERATPSPFVNSEPIREEQVQNAVKFLSHPKVRGSPVMYRRSFLERKGLTKEEIDDAFRRVPDPTPSATASQPVVANQDGQLNSSSAIQQQVPTQTLQRTQAPSTGSISRLGLYQFHWSHVLYAIGFLAVSGAGTAVLLKKTIIPRLKSWIRKVVLKEEEGEPLVEKGNAKPNLAEEAAAAAKAAAAAAADVARASQEMLMSKTEEKRYFSELTNLLDVQIREMKTMSNAVQKLQDKGESSIPGRIATREEDDHRVSVVNSRQPYSNGKVDNRIDSVISSSPPSSVEPSAAPHPKSYMEIMAMVQRGERPSNIREINDQPPNPNQPVPNPRLVPKPKPWEVGQSQSSSGSGFQYQESSNGFTSGSQTIQLNADGSVPWWQQKNARITEIESEDEQNIRSSVPSEKPVQRSWVPPQPPPVAMAEAAAAIRQPKKPLLQKEQLTDDHLLGRASEVTDELQRITKISEAGGLEANGGNLANNASEIQKEEEQAYTET
nr:peroxisomal membrane protein PEX14-like [Coffea arabica]